MFFRSWIFVRAFLLIALFVSPLIPFLSQGTEGRVTPVVKEGKEQKKTVDPGILARQTEGKTLEEKIEIIKHSDILTEKAKRKTIASLTGTLKAKKPFDKPREAVLFYNRQRQPSGSKGVPTTNYFAFAPRFAPPVRPQAGAGSHNWLNIGPDNVAGRIRALVVQDSNTIYVGGVAGGIWKTTDGGTTWSPLNDLMVNLAVTSLVQAGNTSILYAGTGENFSADGRRGAGIFKTTDAGATWTQLSATATADFYYVTKIVISPTNDNVLYASTSTGIFKSTDAGTTWTQVNAAGQFSDLAIRSNGGVDYLYGWEKNAGLAVSYDAGATWTYKIGDGTVNTNNSRGAIAPAASAPGTVYVTASDALGVLTGVYKTTDDFVTAPTQVAVLSGTTQQIKMNNLLFTNAIYGLSGVGGVSAATGCWGTDTSSGQGWYDQVIAVDPTDANRVWVGGVDLWLSTDGGANWLPASQWWGNATTGYNHADHHAIVFDPAYDGTTNKTIFFGNDGGIFKTTDGTLSPYSGPCTINFASGTGKLTYTSLNNGLNITQFYHGSVSSASGFDLYLAGAQDNGTNAGDSSSRSWTDVNGGDGGFTAIHQANVNILYSNTTHISPQLSTDGGSTWTDISTGINTTTGGNGLFINPMLMDPNDSNRVWVVNRIPWRTTDQGTTWTQAGAALSATATASALAIAPGNSDLMYIGLDDGSLYKTTTATTSTSATSWTSVGFFDLPSGYIHSIAIDPVDNNIVYVAYSTFGVSHLWRTTDGGTTWATLDGTGSTGIPDVPALSIAISPNNSAHLYLGTDLGILYSTDTGATWTSINNTGLANTPVELVLFQGNKKIYAFTHGRGVYMTAAPGYTDVTAPANTTVAAGFIDGGATSTSSSSLSLTLSATDDVGLGGYYISESSTTPSASASGWVSLTAYTAYSGTVSYSYSTTKPNQTVTIYVWFKDAAGNISSPVSGSITSTIATVPTLSEWGIALLLLLLITGEMLYRRKPREAL